MQLFKRKHAAPANLPENPFSSLDSLSAFFGCVALGTIRGTIRLEVAREISALFQSWAMAAKYAEASEHVTRSRWVEEVK